MFSQRTFFKLNRFIRKTWKFFLIITAGLLFLYFIIYNIHPLHISPKNPIDPCNKDVRNPPTNINHLCFGIAGSSKTWSHKRGFIQSWWRPNTTRGFIFMEKTPVEHLPWPKNYPPLQISKENSQYKDYDRHDMPFAIRMVRVIEQTFFEEQNEGGVRWFVMADDDTVFLLDNLVRVLSKYDHTKHFYVGMNSECVVSNSLNSFDMAFGGGGYALSYPLAKAVAKNMDLCIKRYPNVFGSDHMLQSCVADMGVSLTQERGFHQIDFHRDISGFLSAHPHTPFLSLHHLDAVDPIFPSLNRIESLNHLMKASSLDQSRMLQQSVCYQKSNNWTISVSWGYSVQLYEKILPPSFLVRPLETFIPWRKGAKPPYMFNTRRVTIDDPCDKDRPHLFYFDDGSVHREVKRVVMHYRRADLRQCNSTADHREAEHIARIHVISSSDGYNWLDGSKRECCDVAQLRVGTDYVEVKLRECEEDEIIVA